MSLSNDILTKKIIKIFNSKVEQHLSINDLDKCIKNDLKVDSIEMTNIIVMAEKLFHVPIFDDECESIVTIGDFAQLIEGKINE